MENKTGLRKTVRSREVSGLGRVSGPEVSVYSSFKDNQRKIVLKNNHSLLLLIHLFSGFVAILEFLENPGIRQNRSRIKEDPGIQQNILENPGICQI